MEKEDEDEFPHIILRVFFLYLFSSAKVVKF